MPLTWDDPEDIAFELVQTHPDTDPLDLNFVDLHAMVVDLPEFGDDPDAASETKLEAIVLAGMTSSEQVLGLFPLGLVLLPGELLPLHIYEERYKRLIGECRETGDVFGIVLRHEDNVAECGCTAEVTSVLEEFDDGRLNIVVRGQERFRLHELFEPDDEDDYLRARVTVYDDDEPAAPARVLRKAESLYRRLLELADVEAEAGAGEGGEASFRMAGTVDFGLMVKQQLLESRSEADRLDQLVGLMSSLVPRLELRKSREEAIRGNGKGY